MKTLLTACTLLFCLPGWAYGNDIPLQPVTPSMWWIVERAPAGWVNNFTIDSNMKMVKISLELPLWNRADYLQRFTFLRQLGLEAQKAGYGVLLLDEQKILAEYQIKNSSWQYHPPNLGTFPFRPDTGIRR